MDFYRDARALLLYAAAIMLVLGAAYLAGQPRGVHLVQARVLVQDTQGYPAPSRHVDWRDIPGQWRTVALPHAPRPDIPTKPGETDTLPTRTTWYHFQLGPGQTAPPDSYLYIPRWKSDGEIAIYVDGVLSYQSHANLQWNGSNRSLWLPLEDAAETTPPKDILIRIRHVRGLGGALSTAWLGDYRQLAAAYYVRNFFQIELPYLSSAMFLATGVFAFLIWLRRRGETLFLLFAAMTVAAPLRVMHTFMGTDRLPISDAWFGWLTVNSLAWMILITHLFLLRLHHHRQPVLTVVLAVTSLALNLLTLPLLAGTFDATVVSPIMYAVMGVLAILTFGLGLYRSW